MAKADISKVDMTKYERQFTKKQMEAIEMLTDPETTMVQVAKVLGVNERTVRRWKQDELFRSALDDLMRDQYASLVPKAIKVMSEQLESQNQWIRQNAARAILDKWMPSTEKETGKMVVQFQMPQPAMPPAAETIEAEGGIE